jgi:SAM-dependent methyltransferase
MLSYASTIAAAAEQESAAGDSVTRTLENLRALPLDDFAEFLMLSPQPAYPGLGKLLPRMASAEAQQQWTGSDGYTLLRQTLAFVRTVSQTYAEIYGRSMNDLRMLDFGCGYGRILRLMYYYSNPERMFGCDPWDKALDLCRNDGLLGQFAQSDYIPTKLPFSEKFDLIYAFSVFTHLSLNATMSSLQTLGRALAPDGMLVITIRPIEYWDYDLRPSQEIRDELKQSHLSQGFAYVPHGNIVSAGEAVYGDTSMSFEFVQALVPDLRLVRFTRSLDDPYQIILFFRN